MGVKTKTKKTRRYGIDRVQFMVSIPRKLKTKMDKFKKRNETNWSVIATTAFRHHMKEKE